MFSPDEPSPEKLDRQTSPTAAVTTYGASFTPDALLSRIETVRRSSEFHPTNSIRRLDKIEALSLETFAADADEATFKKLAASWQAEGMTLTAEADPAAPSGKIWLIEEMPDARWGRGFFLVRKSADLPISLELPHGDSDLGTDAIGVKLCLEHAVRACAWNTVHRRQMDVAHSSDSVWQRFLKASMERWPEHLVVQVHGFDGGKRRTSRARKAGMIFSSGLSSGHGCIAAGLTELGRLEPSIAARLFGRDVRELGATTNAQAALLRGMGAGHFVHIEMNKGERRRIENDEAARRNLMTALLTMQRDYAKKAGERAKTDFRAAGPCG